MLGIGALEGRRRAVGAVVAVSALVVAVTPLAAAGGKRDAVPLHTKRQAEVNVLRSLHAIRKLNLGFVDPRTRLLRAGVQVQCMGEGRRASAYHRFRCRLQYRTATALFAYLATGRRAWHLHALRPARRT